MDYLSSNYSLPFPEHSRLSVAPELFIISLLEPSQPSIPPGILRTPKPSLAACVLLVCVAVLLRYAVTLISYHWAHRTHKEGQLPPKYPFLIPFLGLFIPFLWDNKRFFRNVT